MKVTKKIVIKKQSYNICKLFTGSLVLNPYSSYVIGNFNGAPYEKHLHVAFCISQQGLLAGAVSGCFLRGQGSHTALHPSLVLHIHRQSPLLTPSFDSAAGLEVTCKMTENNL